MLWKNTLPHAVFPVCSFVFLIFFFPSASTKTLTQGKRTPHSFVAGDTVLLLLPVKMKRARHLPPLMQEAVTC